MLYLFNHLFGAIYGLLRGCLATAALIVLTAFNSLGTLFFYGQELYYELVGGAFTLAASLNHCLLEPLVELRLLDLIYNSLILSVVYLPIIAIQTAFNLVVSSLSLAFDLALNLVCNSFGALFSPFASLFEGIKTGLFGSSAPPSPEPPSNIFRSLGAKTLNHNLPLNEYFSLNEIAGSKDLLYPQNTLFAKVRVESFDNSVSLMNFVYTLTS